jgi:hypothetical protein
MLEPFWGGLGTKIADRLLAALLGPALVFWTGGALAGILRFGWKESLARITPLIEHRQLAVFIAVPTLVVVSAAIEQALVFPMLRVLEGYGPLWRPLRVTATRRIIARARRARRQWAILAELDFKKKLSATQRACYVSLDLELRRIPVNPADLMPTALGNVLRAAERRPSDRYGLDAVVCLPRLWLLLPSAARDQISDARAALNTGAGVWLWGLLFLVWTTLTLWAVPVALVAMVAAYRWLLSSAETYGDLLESAFDLYRTNLYESLRWPLPDDTDAEIAAGVRLTEYLFRGTVATPVRYAPASAATSVPKP